MTRPVRPYRATYVGATRTVHYDYETKEARKLLEGPRDQAGQGGIPVTVTSRKPLKPGTPVCWVNVYADGYPASHRTKAFADGAAAGLSRLHCIPVYLPGEGAESPAQQVDNRLAKMAGDARAEVERLTTLAKDWETTARAGAEERDAALTESAQLRAKAELRENQLTSALNAAAAHKAEVARLTAELAEARVTWGSAEIASLRKLYAAALEVRSWFDPPKHVQNALIRAVHDHAEKFGKPTEQP